MKYKFSKLNQNIQAALISLAILIAIVAVVFLFTDENFVPDNFVSARHESALIAKDIVALTETSLSNLEKVSEADQQYNFKKALEIVREELENVRQAKLKAIELTGKLVIMTEATAGINPTKARNMAIEAISNELSLINHILVYNDILNGLLQTLELKFSGDIRRDVQDVQILVKNMNQETKEINNLNKLFNDKLSKFDELVKD